MICDTCNFELRAKQVLLKSSCWKSSCRYRRRTISINMSCSSHHDSKPKNARIAHIYSFIAILWLIKFRWRRNTAIYLINSPPTSSDAEPSHACLLVPPSVTGMAPAAGEESGDPGRRKACVVVLGDLGWYRCLYRERLGEPLSHITINPSILLNALK